MTDQERAKEKAVRELASWLGPVTNLRDPEAGARKFIDWLIGEHWRCIPPPPIVTATGDGVPAEAHADELDAVRKACATASDKHHRKDARQAISCGASCYACRFGDCYDPPRPHTWIDDEPLPADAVTEHPCACNCSKEIADA